MAHGHLGRPADEPEIKREAGFLVYQLEKGVSLSMPHSKPMPSIGSGVHELRIRDGKVKKAWRVIYRIDQDAIVLVHWFEKKTTKTPKAVIDLCQRRLADYDEE